MDEFTTVLRGQVDDRLKTLDVARRAGHDYEVHLHGARIRDLLDMAARRGIATDNWVDPAVLEDALLDSTINDHR